MESTPLIQLSIHLFIYMESLGIDFKLFLGQIINFLILMLILWRFAYKPILKMLNDRREKIAESLDNAKKIEEKLASTEEKTRQMLEQAKGETDQMIQNARKLATEQKNEIVETAKTQAEKEIDKAKIAISEEKDLAAEALRKEMLKLVALATEKILAKQPAEALQQQAIDEAIEELDKK